MENAVTWTDVAQVGLVAAQLLVLVAAAIFAWRQVKEARELREEQNRPFVVVDFDVEGGYLVHLQVENMGTSLARDVQIDIDPPLESAIEIEIGKLKMLNEGIATLAPGKRYRAFFDMSFRRNEERPDLPMNYTARVRYSDDRRKRSFDEVLNLDLDQYMHINTVTRHDLHDIHKQLEQLRKVLEKWTSGTGSGLLALSLEESRAENERRYAAMKERQKQREDQAGDSDGEHA
jgi:hypothetical protein